MTSKLVLLTMTNKRQPICYQPQQLLDEICGVPLSHIIIQAILFFCSILFPKQIPSSSSRVSPLILHTTHSVKT